LPDFSWFKIPIWGKLPKDHKIYQISLNIPNCHKVCKSNASLQGLPKYIKMGFLV
jgi:hypothetical protein